MLNKFKVNNELQCPLATYKTERWYMLACNWTCCNSFPSRFLNRIKGNFDKNEFNITKIEIQQWLKSTWIFFCFIQFCCCLVLFFGKGCPCALARIPFTVACPSLPYLLLRSWIILYVSALGCSRWNIHARSGFAYNKATMCELKTARPRIAWERKGSTRWGLSMA